MAVAKAGKVAKARGSGTEQTRFLEATFKELKRNRAELSQKKEKLQMKLEELRENLQISVEKEKQLVGRLRELKRVEAKFEDVLHEEKTLSKEKVVTEEELTKVQQNLNKIKKLYETLQQPDDI